MMAEVDADIPGITDSRLAGWRVGSKEAAATAAEDTAAVDSDADSEGEAGESGEPGCGDVVEVRTLCSRRPSWHQLCGNPAP